MRWLRLLLPVVGLFAGACAQPVPASAPKPDLASEEKAIREMDARWLKAVASRDPSAEAAVFAEDGVAYREHIPPVVGPAAYQAYATKFYSDNPKANGMWTTDAIRIADSGDLAIQTGEFHLAALGVKGDREDKGRFVTVWRKTSGTWKVAYDIGSTTMPETAATKR